MKDKKLDTMTVGQLRAELAKFPDDTLVGFDYPAGDHWRTHLVGEILSVEKMSVGYTPYHSCFRLLTEKELEGRDPADVSVVILSSQPF